MIVWTRRRSLGARDLVNEIKQMGGHASHVVARNCPPGAVPWGRGGGNKFMELTRLAAAKVPVPGHSLSKQPGWLARRFKHHEANDLLKGLTAGDYYVEYVPTVREFRVHIFDGRSVRVGMKQPRIPNPHPKFRSWRSGWHILYDSECQKYITKEVRSVAKQAVEALKYDFGAVDIGLRENGKAVVWEVNSAPGLEGNTIKTYAQCFIGKYT